MMMLNIYDGRWVIGDCKLVNGYDVCLGFFIFNDKKLYWYIFCKKEIVLYIF